MIAKTLKYFFGFIGLIIAFFFLQHLFWFLYLGYWDSQVRAMCLEDGGVEVYETIILTEEEARQLGWDRNSPYVLSADSLGANEARFLARRNERILKDGTPRVVRYESTFYQVSDQTELGQYVNYSRIGTGAILTLATGSSFSCANVEGVGLDIERQIFQVEE